MSTAAVLPVAIQQFLDDDGNPLAGGKLFSYQAGTTTPIAFYTDVTLLVPYTNPIILNSAGRTVGPVWPYPTVAYDLVLKNSADVTVWTANSIIPNVGSA